MQAAWCVPKQIDVWNWGSFPFRLLQLRMLWLCCLATLAYTLFQCNTRLLHCFKFTTPLHKAKIFSILLKTKKFQYKYILFNQISFLFYILKIRGFMTMEYTVLETMTVKAKWTGCKRIIAGRTQQLFSWHWTLCTKVLGRNLLVEGPGKATLIWGNSFVNIPFISFGSSKS